MARRTTVDANEPAYREMYLSFEPDSQLVTTRVLPSGWVVRAVERYRLVEDKLIINAGYQVSGDEMTITA
jgi:hypothetical protein